MNMALSIRKVDDQADVKAFHQLPYQIYKNTPQWLPPFQFEIEKIFSKEDNPYFEEGECERFLVVDDDEVVGRFAVMNHRKNDIIFSPKLGGIGFIEMIDDQAVADAIIDFAKQWHRSRGYTVMRGPINFGGIYNYWGLLVDNFIDPPIYGMQYHHPYYQKLLENTNAEKFQDHFSYIKYFTDDIPKRIQTIAGFVEKRPEVSWRCVDVNHIERDVRYIHEIYTKAWSNQEIEQRSAEFMEISLENMLKSAKQFKPILQPEANLIAFVDNQPASFVTVLPDLNEFSAKTKGRLHWWQILKLMRFKNYATRSRILIFGTVPEYRKMGLEALLYIKGHLAVRKNYPKMSRLEASWIAEDNWLSQRSAEALGLKHYKTHRTYRWEFGK